MIMLAPMKRVLIMLITMMRFLLMLITMKIVLMVLITMMRVLMMSDDKAPDITGFSTKPETLSLKGIQIIKFQLVFSPTTLYTVVHCTGAIITTVPSAIFI